MTAPRQPPRNVGEAAIAAGVGLGALGAVIWSAASHASYATVIDGRTSLPVLTQLHVRSVHELVASPLLAIFFFGVGLELARERRHGILAHRRHAVSPIIAALGGMAATAIVQTGIGLATSSTDLVHGWGVPMATDVALVLGVAAAAGRRLPPTARLFLLALAVTDDVVSVVVLGLVGGHSVRPAGVVLIVAAGVALYVLSRRVSGTTLRWVFLVVLWALFAWTGVEPALSGVLAGIVVPSDTHSAERLEPVASWYSNRFILPAFALVSCGLDFSQLSWHGPIPGIVAGVAAARIAGKTLGIVGGVMVARHFGYDAPVGVRGRVLWGSGLVCSMGITIPVLFADALFPSDVRVTDAFTAGLLLATAVGAAAALLVWRGPSLLQRLNRART